MNNLNDVNENTKGIIHIMVTSLCDRDCPYCCNKQYDLNDIPYVTKEELQNAHTICITGGEPFIYSNPVEIARKYKSSYKNINKVYCYSNAFEFLRYVLDNIRNKDSIKYLIEPLDGLSISIKNNMDIYALNSLYENKHNAMFEGKSNRLYCFLSQKEIDKVISKETWELICNDFQVIERKWQKEFKPAIDSIFRKA